MVNLSLSATSVIDIITGVVSGCWLPRFAGVFRGSGYISHTPTLCLLMGGNVIATAFALFHVLWVLPIGYFAVISIINGGQSKAR